jgi:hypothetical protein
MAARFTFRRISMPKGVLVLFDHEALLPGGNDLYVNVPISFSNAPINFSAEFGLYDAVNAVW